MENQGRHHKSKFELRDLCKKKESTLISGATSQ